MRSENFIRVFIWTNFENRIYRGVVIKDYNVFFCGYEIFRIGNFR